MSSNQNEILKINNEIKIPDNLLKLLKSDTYVLLIKGGPGTGKTSLALTILLSLHAKNRSTFISTRVSPSKLFQYHGWLEKFFTIPKKLSQQEDSEVVTDSVVFVDGRLYESGTLYERISNELLDTKEPVIIIDSIDAIESFTDKETLRNDAKILQTWCERSRAKVIITVEDPNDSTFDYIADGIIELKDDFFKGHKMRKIVLTKLRGIKIERASYFFTLNNGIFRSFEPYNPSAYETSFLPMDSVPLTRNVSDLFVESYFSTGYNELDKALRGGFPRRRVIDLIIDPNISSGVIVVLLSKIIANFTLEKNPVLFQGFDKLDSNFLGKEIEASFPDAANNGLIKIFPPIIPRKINESSNLDQRYRLGKDHIEYINNNVTKMKKEFPDKLLINIMGFDISDIYYNTETTIVMKSLINFIKTNTALSILVSRHLGVENNISQKSEICLRLLIIDSTLFLLSLTPMSQLFAVIPADYRHVNMRLAPVV